MDHNPASWGQPYSIQVPKAPLKHSQYNYNLCYSYFYVYRDPIVTGASVLALRYKDGVMMAADTLASYGSLARFRNVQRLNSLDEKVLLGIVISFHFTCISFDSISRFNSFCFSCFYCFPCFTFNSFIRHFFYSLGTSGDIGDMQFTLRWLYEFSLNERLQADGHHLNALNYFTILQQLLYKKRSEMDPMWNTHVVAGPNFLGAVDLRGTCWTSSVVATGFGAHLALPLLRNQVEGRVEEIDENEAKALLEKCMQVLWSRHARASNVIQFAKVTSLEGVEISQPIKIKADWSVAYI